MPGLEHYRRKLERRLLGLRSMLKAAEAKARKEGEVGRAVLEARASHLQRAAGRAERVLDGFRREALRRLARAGEPASRALARCFTRRSPLLVRLWLCWSLDRALFKTDDLFREKGTNAPDDDDGGGDGVHGQPEKPAPPPLLPVPEPARGRLQMPGGEEDSREAAARPRQAQRDRRTAQGHPTPTAGAQGPGETLLVRGVVYNDAGGVQELVELRMWRRAP